MSQVLQILNDINREANERNDEVVSLALRRQHRCNCGYLGHTVEFRDLLSQYITYKKLAHAWRRDVDRRHYARNWSSAFSNHQYCIGKAQQIRVQLEQIWPCNECMQRFNPTKRMRVNPNPRRSTIPRDSTEWSGCFPGSEPLL